jgi:hypothetical protein
VATENTKPQKSTEVEEVEASAVPITVETVPVDGEPETLVVTETTPPATQVIIVDAPVRPKPKGNRGIGVLFAFLASLVYGALYAVAYLVVQLVVAGPFSLLFVSDPSFFFAVPLFFVGMVLVVLVLNRAGWWAHIFGSVVVGLVVWFGTASLVLISSGMFSMTQAQANDTFFASLWQPTTIVAALLAREVAIWTGAVIARRGRKVKARNVEAVAKFEQEQADLIPSA